MLISNKDGGLVAHGSLIIKADRSEIGADQSLWASDATVWTLTCNLPSGLVRLHRTPYRTWHTI